MIQQFTLHLLLPAKATAVSFSASSLSFFDCHQDKSQTIKHNLMKFFSRICTITASKILLQGHGSNVKVAGFFACLCLHDTAATRGQCLALSKAWQSSFIIVLLIMRLNNQQRTP